MLQPMLEPLAPPAPSATWLAYLPSLKPFFPLFALVGLTPLLFWFFRSTWATLDEEANQLRREEPAGFDKRAYVAFVITGVALTLQFYFGGRTSFEETVIPQLSAFQETHPWIQVAKYRELYGFAWWSFTRICTYLALPFVTWKVLFPKDALLDFGLRTQGFWKHLGTYSLFLAIVLPATWIVSYQPDFGAYYPFYRLASRSVYDLLVWEALYFCQFFVLELFFRGWLLGALKRLGSSAIFAMAVPYCMIHYGKPYFETMGAIVAGIALGSLSMKTKSIYQGFFLHISVAGLMDFLALAHRHALPTTFWPIDP